MSFVDKRYTKGVPFLSKTVCQRIRGGGWGGKVGGPSSNNTLLSAPLAHWAIITSPSERLCVLLLLFIVTFYAFRFFFVFNWNASIFLASKPHVCSFDQFSHDKSHVNIRPIKTFLHDKPGGSSFPVRWWESICPISCRICKLLAVFISLAIMGWLNLLTKCLIM